jgi:hypothetical protein
VGGYKDGPPQAEVVVGAPHLTFTCFHVIVVVEESSIVFEEFCNGRVRDQRYEGKTQEMQDLY